MKKIIASMLVVLFVVSITPIQAISSEVDSSSKQLVEKRDFAQTYGDSSIKFYQNEEWTCSIANDGDSTIFIAINRKDGTLYEKIVENSMFTWESVENVSINTVFEEGFKNIGKEKIVNKKIVNSNLMNEAMRSNSSSYGLMCEMMDEAEGRSYTNKFYADGTYQNKYFTIKETKDVSAPIRSDHIVGVEIQAGLTLAAVLSIFVDNGISFAITTVADFFGLVANIASLVPRNTIVDVYYASATYLLATYNQSVSYVLNSTAKTNNYAFITEVYATEVYEPVMEFEGTVYQHTPNYYNNTSLQIIDAYNNLFG